MGLTGVRHLPSPPPSRTSLSSKSLPRQVAPYLQPFVGRAWLPAPWHSRALTTSGGMAGKLLAGAGKQAYSGAGTGAAKRHAVFGRQRGKRPGAESLQLPLAIGHTSSLPPDCTMEARPFSMDNPLQRAPISAVLWVPSCGSGEGAGRSHRYQAGSTSHTQHMFPPRLARPLPPAPRSEPQPQPHQ